jgi:hypothetical protein
MKIKNINFKLEKQKYLNDIKNLNTKLFNDEYQNKINNGPQIKKLFIFYQCTNDGKLINPIKAFNDYLWPIIFINSILITIWFLTTAATVATFIKQEFDSTIIFYLSYIFFIPFFILINLK